MQVLKDKMRNFVLTWSKQKSVWSTVAPGISICSEGVFLAPETLFKSAIVIMSCQPLFIEVFDLFLSPFWPLLSVSLKRKSFWEVPELYGMELIRYRDVFIKFRKKKKKKKK
jgi:hypothetical protein